MILGPGSHVEAKQCERDIWRWKEVKRGVIVVLFLSLKESSCELKGTLWIQWRTDSFVARRGRQSRWSDSSWWNSRSKLSLYCQNSRWRCAAKPAAESHHSHENKLLLHLAALVNEWLWNERWFNGKTVLLRLSVFCLIMILCDSQMVLLSNCDTWNFVVAAFSHRVHKVSEWHKRLTVAGQPFPFFFFSSCTGCLVLQDHHIISVCFLLPKPLEN